MSPRVEFSTENKVATSNYDYPKLKLKMGERARILLLESPVVEYVHTLRKPQIISGVPQTYMAERKDKTQYEDYVKDFMSKPLCLGDLTVLADKGSDPKNCPICKLAQTNPDFTDAPARRYAMHVIRYRTKGGTTELTTPFAVETLVWAFTDKTFNKIVDFREEWEDLRKHDLLLGPCTNENYQQFDITVAAKAAWLGNDEDKMLTARTFKENQIPDLSIACGSAKERKWIDEDLEAIVEAWTIVKGAENTSTSSTDLDSDLNDILTGGKATVEEEVWPGDAEKPADDTDDLLASLGSDDTESPEEDSSEGSDDVDALLSDTEEEPEVKEKPKAAPKKPAAKKAEPVEEPPADNFDDLLKDMS